MDIDALTAQLSNLLTPAQKQYNIAGLDSLMELLTVKSEERNEVFQEIQKNTNDINDNTEYILHETPEGRKILSNYCFRFLEAAPQYSISPGYLVELVSGILPRGAEKRSILQQNPYIISALTGPKRVLPNGRLRGTAPFGFIKKDTLTGKYFIQIISNKASGRLSDLKVMDFYEGELVWCNPNQPEPLPEAEPMAVDYNQPGPSEQIPRSTRRRYNTLAANLLSDAGALPTMMNTSFGKRTNVKMIKNQINRINNMIKMLKMI